MLNLKVPPVTAVLPQGRNVSPLVRLISVVVPVVALLSPGGAPRVLDDPVGIGPAQFKSAFN